MENKINWEQRRYEVAKDLFVGMCIGEIGWHFSHSDIGSAIRIANEFIEEFKKQNKDGNYNTNDETRVHKTH